MTNLNCADKDDVVINSHLANSISLRAVAQSDMPSLQAMYKDSRAKEMAYFPFTEEQSIQFLDMQFKAQHQHYQTHYPNASYDCILLDNELIGRLYVNRDKNDIQLIDILLFSSHCNRGIGSYLISQLINEANDSQRRITAHVEISNPARHLYQRLGFVETENQDPYILIVKKPLSS
ncbi:GNAT family N-acetyltransferase [Undibacterium danionis]|uniref:GNAT family N-acetyltransferase n=1 Tax=Undibacterium danionis TaxID=1812100 RepID=A0ABV6IIT0_9BURK